MNGAQSKLLIHVWDIPVRLFHWLLVLLVIALYVTGKLGGNWLEWHKRAGFSVLGLIIFRIIWGFVGNDYARFANFVYGPTAVLAYLKALVHNNARQYSGHNPLGAISVVTMLALLLLQAVLGLFSNDDIMLEGPYARLVSRSVSNQLTSLHKLNADLILMVVGVHVAAIAFSYFYKKDNLVKAMITGKKSPLPGSTCPSPRRPVWLSWAIGAGVAIATYALLNKSP